MENKFKFIGLEDENSAKISLRVGLDEWHDFTMTADDIRSNMEKFGHHAELDKALLFLSSCKAEHPNSCAAS